MTVYRLRASRTPLPFSGYFRHKEDMMWEDMKNKKDYIEIKEIWDKRQGLIYRRLEYKNEDGEWVDLPSRHKDITFILFNSDTKQI